MSNILPTKLVEKGEYSKRTFWQFRRKMVYAATRGQKSRTRGLKKMRHKREDI